MGVWTDVSGVLRVLMGLEHLKFRGMESALDADRQYCLWLRATQELPLAWGSSLRNARSMAARAEAFPGSRIYAENRQGDLVGYIGTHPPFEWGELGSAAPFGFPWTWPRDEGLEVELYDRMVSAIPLAYGQYRPRAFIQRFRTGWERQLGFMAARGWTERFRNPIWSRAIPNGHREGAGGLRLLGADGLEVLAAHADHDVAETSRPSVSSLGEREAAGWFTMERCWESPGAGAFAFTVRNGVAEVELFYAREERVGEVLLMLQSAASAHGATRVYFTLGEAAKRRMDQLAGSGFAQTDADVYMALTLGDRKEG